MKNYPYDWFRNIVRLLEKRPYAVFNVLLFSLFVGACRLFSEWALGGVYPRQLLPSLLTVSGFYWFSFFAVAAVLATVVDQPWRVSINAVLVGVFLGVFPPIVDAAAGGTGFNYAFMWNLPADWRWAIYNPEKNIPLGEAVILWSVIALTALYAHLKTASPQRTFLAAVLAYAAVMVIAGLPATISEAVRAALEWPLNHRAVLQVCMQYALAFAFYLYLQRSYAAALFRNAWRGAPYAALCLGGAAFAGGLGSTAALYTGLLALVLAAAFAWSPRARTDGEDRKFAGITMLLILAAVAAANSTAVIPLSFVAFSVLAGARLPRWARGGALAGGSFLLGIIGAVEYAAYGAPRWWLEAVPRPLHPEALHGFDGAALAAAGAVFAAGAIAAQWRGAPRA